MSEPLVLTEAEGPVLVVTINRPEKKNAANAEVLCRLYDAWVRLDIDDSLRVAILTGKGDTFCAGMDLAEIGRLREGIVDNEWLQRLHTFVSSQLHHRERTQRLRSFTNLSALYPCFI
jgi:enoyl-CoA hydratase